MLTQHINLRFTLERYCNLDVYKTYHSLNQLISIINIFLWMSQWLLFNVNSAIIQLYRGENKLIFNEMMMRSRLTRLVWFFYSASSLKLQSADRHVAPLGHIILILSQPAFALSPWCCVPSGEVTNTYFIVFGLTRSRLEPTIYRTWGEHANHYTTNAVIIFSYIPYIQTQCYLRPCRLEQQHAYHEV